MTTQAIEIHGLSKTFVPSQGWRRWLRRPPVTAVADINLTVPAGELFGLLGPNGAGKTTLVKMLCTLILPSAGVATVAGHPLRRAGAIRSVVGLVVSDERSFYWRLSARRNLLFFAAAYGLYGRIAQERVTEVLTAVDLPEVADRRFSEFSSGMRQRLAIARSLLHRPQILFLDEPSRSLDPRATQRLHDLIRQLMAEQALTVFLITHNLAEAEALCGRVALMHRGRIQADGAPAMLRRRLRARRRYTLLTDPVPADVLATLAGVPGFRYEESGEVARIYFRAQAGDDVLTAVLDILRARNLTIHQVESKPPTLAEVFNHFTGEGAAA